MSEGVKPPDRVGEGAIIVGRETRFAGARDGGAGAGRGARCGGWRGVQRRNHRGGGGGSEVVGVISRGSVSRQRVGRCGRATLRSVVAPRIQWCEGCRECKVGQGCVVTEGGAGGQAV